MEGLGVIKLIYLLSQSKCLVSFLVILQLGDMTSKYDDSEMPIKLIFVDEYLIP